MQAQLDKAAKFMSLSPDVYTILSQPKNEVIINFPVRMDDGRYLLFKGYRVQHNNILGPYKGGIRYHEDVSLDELKGLSAAMTWKSALHDIPFGGGKGGIKFNPRLHSKSELERITRRYTHALGQNIGPEFDIPAPDVGTNEQVMAWMMDTYSNHVGYICPGVVTGKPIAVGGSQGRREATGAGVAYLVGKYLEDMKCPVREATVALQGFGNVGSETALALAEMGAKIVAISDYTGGVHNPAGIDIRKALAYLQSERVLKDFGGGSPVTNEQLLELPCTVLIPAALERVITPENAPKLRCRLLAEAANGPTTNAADRIIEERGDIEVIPDVLCNSGGVIVSYFEWLQNQQSFYWGRDEVISKLHAILDKAKESVEYQKRKFKFSRRLAALTLGIGRVAEAKQKRGLFP